MLLLLAAIQFTVIADFMTMSPIGPVLMTAFDIGPRELGLLVAAYTFAAAISGLVGAMIADRFDRKHWLLGLYGGFLLSLAACSVAPSYWSLLGARALGGAFAGVIGATIMTIVGDRVPESRRGRATGVVMTAFSIATVAGVPLGLLVAGRYGWHAPFVVLGVSSALIWLLSWRLLPSVTAHLQARRALLASGGTLPTPLAHLTAVVREPRHLRAFGLVVLVTGASFLVIPFISLHMALNVGIALDELSIIYLIGGAATFLTARTIGQLADRFGKPRVFRWLAVCAAIPFVLITYLPPMSVWGVSIVTTLFFVLVSGRLVPMMAIVTTVAEPRLRGAFMSLNQTIQSLTQGAATFVASLTLARSADGGLLHYEIVGWMAGATSLLSWYWVTRVRPASAVGQSVGQSASQSAGQSGTPPRAD